MGVQYVGFGWKLKPRQKEVSVVNLPSSLPNDAMPDLPPPNEDVLVTNVDITASKPVEVSPFRPRWTVKVIKEVICKKYKISMNDLETHRKTNNVVLPRQIAMHVAKEMSRLSLSSIGRIFDRDHTTVLHAIKKIDKLINTDPLIAAEIMDIKARVRESCGIEFE